MTRRKFVHLTASSAAALGSIGVLGCRNSGDNPGQESLGEGPAGESDGPVGENALQRQPAPDSDAGFSVWAWVHGSRDRDSDQWRVHFARIREAGVESVLVGGGDTPLVSEAAHAEGLAFHRWFWTMNRNGDSWAVNNHPEWFTVNRLGESSLEKPPYVGYYKWVCPSREEVREYLSGKVRELAEEPGVDGVHLDYVRHCDVILPRGLWKTYDLVQDVEHPEFDYCYCEVCRSQFAEVTGRDPMEMADPTRDEEWRRFRWDSVTGAVRRLVESVHAGGKPITAAVFPTPTIARRLVRQAWDEWPLDRYFPMLYNGFYLEDIDWIGKGVQEGVAAIGSVPLNTGLYLPDLNPTELADAVAVARDAGAAGVSFFESNGLSDEHLEALKGVLA